VVDVLVAARALTATHRHRLDGKATISSVICHYTPMAPTLVREPFRREGWIYEEKVDGWRMLAYKDGPRVRLVSRNGVDHTRRFHDIATAILKLSARTLVLDAQLAVTNQ
jgi:bifunctional non-homologous end joining protein LigD